MQLLQQLVLALQMAFSMFWEVLWPLILGFALSATVQAVVSHKTMVKTLGKDTMKSHALASLFGIASSSCSYAAVALARSIFQKGASFTNAMLFEIASTNLVIELGAILLVSMGWQFAAAEWLGGIGMLLLLALIFRLTLTKSLVERARKQAKKGLHGKMEGHAAMDMSIKEFKVQNVKFKVNEIITVIAHYFIMDIVSIWLDVFLGFIIAGVLSVFVPNTIWQALFFEHNHLLSFIIGPLVGPLIALISFVCSVGNVPLAAVLWKGGISFGGVVSFIFADLIILPIVDIYRKYYGWKMAGYIFATFYLTMAAAGYIIESLFSLLHIIPSERNMTLLTGSISWNYTTYLNLAFLALATILSIRFVKTDGPAMLKMMAMSPQEMQHNT